MQAVIVYESMFGNTRTIAHAIGAGLAEYFDVAIVPVARAYPATYGEADLVVVGGPTHVHGLSRRPSRPRRPAAASRSSPTRPGRDCGTGSLRLAPTGVMAWRRRSTPGCGARQ